MPKIKLRANQVEMAVAHFFDARRNIIVPNVSWGFGLPFEIDLLVVRPTGYAIEVEIKVVASDIRADLTKDRHLSGRKHKMLKQRWFAVPESLADNPDIPKDCGILSVAESGPTLIHRVTTIRAAANNPRAVKLTDAQLITLCRLAALRIWSLKRHRLQYPHP